MAIGDVWKLTVRWTQYSQQAQNSYYLKTKQAGLPAAADVLTAANAIKEIWRVRQVASIAYTTWEAHEVYSLRVVYDSNLCKRAGGSAVDGAFTGTLTGALASAEMPPQIAGVATLLTGQVGRSRRGRAYIAGLPQAAVASGLWSGAYITQYQADSDSYLTILGPSGTNAWWQLVQWSDTTAYGCKPGEAHPHRLTRYSAPSPQTAASNVTQIKWRPVPYTQRRRVIGVGS